MAPGDGTTCGISHTPVWQEWNMPTYAYTSGTVEAWSGWNDSTTSSATMTYSSDDTWGDWTDGTGGVDVAQHPGNSSVWYVWNTETGEIEAINQTPIILSDGRNAKQRLKDKRKGKRQFTKNRKQAERLRRKNILRMHNLALAKLKAALNEEYLAA